MGSFVEPKVFMVARTFLDGDILQETLESLGVPDWDTDTDISAQALTEFAGKMCYNSLDLSLNRNLTKVGTKTNAEYIEQSILKNGHGSVLEHSTVSFFIQDLSRIVTHEAVRHRAGTAFSQTSGRYVRLDEINMYLPSCILREPRAVEVFRRAIAQMEANTKELAEIFGIDQMADFSKKKELTSAFRRIIGNGQVNNLLLTANHRAWRHMIAMRTSHGAEEEIRVVFGLIAAQLKENFPAIYTDMVQTTDGEWIFEYEKV